MRSTSEGLLASGLSTYVSFAPCAALLQSRIRMGLGIT